ncbi:PTS sugar transporter subunit IIC [Oscillospiraceae bacterium PP1C4]
MIFEALLAALALYVMYVAVNISGCDAFIRPLLIAPAVGLALGDLQTGIILGATLEGLYLGYSSIGGTAPGNAPLGSALATAFAILSGSDMETALALSVPIASAGVVAVPIILSISSALAPKYDALLKQRKYGLFVKMHVSQSFVTSSIDALIVFLGVAFGVEKIDKMFSVLPEFVIHGLSVAGGMLPAVGFAILLNMTLSKEISIFFFVGFVFCKYMNLPIIAITILAMAIAWIIFLADKNTDKAVSVAAGQNMIAEEDFFNE